MSKITYTATASSGTTFTRTSAKRVYTHAVVWKHPDGREFASFATSLARAEAESRRLYPAPPYTRADLIIEVVAAHPKESADA